MTNYQGIVFFDLDGTLWDDHKLVPDNTVKAIKQLTKNNYLPVINSGRSPFEIKQRTNNTGINSFVALDGSYVQVDGKTIYTDPIPNDLVQSVIDKTNELNEVVSFYNKENYAISGITDLAKESYKYNFTPFPKINTDFYQDNPVLMMVIQTRSHEQDYRDAFKGKLDFFRTGSKIIDTVMYGQSKQKGIKNLIAKSDLTNVPTYAFGDGNNDIPMFECVDHPIAMGNGIDKVKDLSEHVTDTNLNDGIPKALKHYDLI